MPKISTESVPIMEGTALLVRRPQTPRWQVKYKVANRWIRTSTKETELEKAKRSAAEIIVEARMKQKLGLPVTTHSFKAVAGAAIKRMNQEVDHGHGKAVYRDYIQAIINYYVPYFGSRHISKVDYKALYDFDEWRASKLGRLPKASTINTHTAALNRVFDEAVMHNYITRSQVPQIKNKAADGERRPDFTIDEYRILYRFMRKWVKQKMHRSRSSEMRLLLRDVVLILANTGIRYGTELYSLRWNHVEMRGGELVLHIPKAKTKKRECIPRRSVKRYLRRIAARTHKELPFEDVLNLGEPIVALADGSTTTSLHQTFRKLLEDAQIKRDPRTDQDRTLYSLRHFYITQALINKRTDFHVLAKQCGTSIKMLEQHYSHLEVWDRREELMR